MNGGNILTMKKSVHLIDKSQENQTKVAELKNLITVKLKQKLLKLITQDSNNYQDYLAYKILDAFNKYRNKYAISTFKGDNRVLDDFVKIVTADMNPITFDTKIKSKKQIEDEDGDRYCVTRFYLATLGPEGKGRISIDDFSISETGENFFFLPFNGNEALKKFIKDAFELLILPNLFNMSEQETIYFTNKINDSIGMIKLAQESKKQSAVDSFLKAVKLVEEEEETFLTDEYLRLSTNI